MTKILTKELNDLFIDTIQRCTLDLINKDDEIIEYELFEEFDVGVTSFLHANSLEILLKEGYINEEIMTLSLKLREMYLKIEDEKHNAKNVRYDKKWHDIFKLGDLIKEKKRKYDKKNYDTTNEGKVVKNSGFPLSRE